MGDSINYWVHLFGVIILMSFGMGLTFVPLTLCAVHGIGERDSGIGSGVLNTMQQLGGALGLATLSTVGACTDTAASSITPSAGADGTTTWWKKYLYADNFHPTPYGHQLLAQMVAKRLTEAGWL